MIRWSEEKDHKLRLRRGVSLARIAEMIENKEYLAILKHPKRSNQMIAVLRIDDYTWSVPFVYEDDGEAMFLKTAFPSRKLHRRYGENG